MLSPGSSPVMSIRLAHLAHVAVTIFSATGFSIRETCHVWVQIAIVETMRSLPEIVSISAEQARPFVGRRLDLFLAAILKRSRTQAQALLKAGLIQVQPDTAKAEASYRLKPGDAVTVHPGPAEAARGEVKGEAIPLEILYEDDALLALNKQPGLVVHPAAGHWSGTLVHALVHHCGARLAGRGGAERLGIVHRLAGRSDGIRCSARGWRYRGTRSVDARRGPIIVC
jgi:ribosomal 50S subunit-recycling heat shock protein